MQMTNFSSSNDNVHKDNSDSSTNSNRNSRRGDNRWSKETSSKDIPHSNQSVLFTMDQFVRTIEDMNETILVPCRLMDMKVGDDTKDNETRNAKRMLNELSSSDLYSFYTMLNTVKNELLWGNSKGTVPALEKSESVTSDTGSVKTHVRRSSTVSLTSSTSVSDIDSEGGSVNEVETDSGVENEEDYAQQIAENFRRHLHGLHHCLRELTSAADFVTSRYQSDVDGSS